MTIQGDDGTIYSSNWSLADTIKLIIVIVAFVSFLIVISISFPIKAETNVVWDSVSCSQSIGINGSMTCGNYTINKTQFSAPVRGRKDFNGNIVNERIVIPSVLFNLYKDNVLIEKSIPLFGVSDNTYINSEKTIQITASGFPDGMSSVWRIESYNPTVTLNVYFRNVSQFKVVISTDKSMYEVGRDNTINLSYSIQNIGQIDSTFIHVIVNSSGLINNEQTTFDFCCLSVNEIRQYSSIISIPVIDKLKNYSFSVSVYWIDSTNGYILSVTSNVIVQIIPIQTHVLVTKYIVNRIYIDENRTITLSVVNSGIKPIYNVYLNDFNNGIVIPSNSTFSWVFPVINSSSQIQVQYKVYPNKVGTGLVLPAAHIEYEFMGQKYKNDSNTQTIDIIDVPGYKRGVVPTIVPTVIPTIVPVITPNSSQPQIIIVNKSPTIKPTVVPNYYRPTVVQTEVPQTYNGISGFEVIQLISGLFFSWIILKHE